MIGNSPWVSNFNQLFARDHELSQNKLPYILYAFRIQKLPHRCGIYWWLINIQSNLWFYCFFLVKITRNGMRNKFWHCHCNHHRQSSYCHVSTFLSEVCVTWRSLQCRMKRREELCHCDIRKSNIFYFKVNSISLGWIANTPHSPISMAGKVAWK